MCEKTTADTDILTEVPTLEHAHTHIMSLSRHLQPSAYTVGFSELRDDRKWKRSTNCSGFLVQATSFLIYAMGAKDMQTEPQENSYLCPNTF